MKDIVTEKGFLVMEVSREELISALGELTMGVCDFCTDSPEVGYYVAVINQWLCKDCYEEWYERAEHYPEDIKFEERNYKYYKRLFNEK